MNSTFQGVLSGTQLETEDALLKISDTIFLNEPIHIIKEKATEAAFTIFVGVQIIGCWKSGGWAVGVFGNFPEIVPYACETLAALGLHDVSVKVSEIKEAFPEGTDFTQNDQAYCDVINFLEGHDRYVKNKEKFAIYSISEREAIRQNYIRTVNNAEQAVENLWGYNSPNNEGWGTLTQYLKKHIDASLWK